MPTYPLPSFSCLPEPEIKYNFTILFRGPGTYFSVGPFIRVNFRTILKLAYEWAHEYKRPDWYMPYIIKLISLVIFHEYVHHIEPLSRRASYDAKLNEISWALFPSYY